MNKLARFPLLVWMLILVMMFAALPSLAEEELSKEELMALLAETVPEGEDDGTAEYLVLPEGYEAPSTDAFQLLLIGTDAYSTKNRGRSDTIILAQLDPHSNTIKLISFMRDLYVKIPGKGSTRINAAYAYGGAELLLKTLKENFGIEPDAYVAVNFGRMANLIDAIGGIEIDVASRELNMLNGILRSYNKIMGYKLNDQVLNSAGLQTLTGKQALSYSRIRKIDSDFQRTNRQRTVIEAAFHKIMSLGWNEIGELVLDNMDAVVTNLQAKDAISLIPLALKAKDATFETMQIPADGAYSSKNIRGMDVLVPNLKKSVELVNGFLYGEE